jgi:exodeoxyribonuclease-3
MLRLYSWNINGLRSSHKTGFLDWLYNEGPDVLGLQEVKSGYEALPEELKNVKGYYSYFHPAKKGGYSGVAVYTKVEPEKVVEGIGVEKFDEEGRVLTLYFKEFVFITAYFPNSGREGRLAYKLEFDDIFLAYIEKIKKSRKKVIFCGDLNVAHEEIDLARPKENNGKAGFHPSERAWADEVIAHGYTDTFRHFYPDKKDAYSYWDQITRARDRNVGWRIDYFFISQNLLPKLKVAAIHPNIYGSDHCPVSISLDI